MDKCIVDLKDVNIYQDNLLILRDVSFKLESGDFYYLIGKTGSGKSSLLKTLYGDLELHEGEGSIVGMDLNTLKPRDIPQLRRKIGIVFQDFQLLTDRTIEKNLYFVLRATGWKDKSYINDRIEEVLTSVGMLDKKHKMPHELSGGEQQRIAIARALLNHPKLILADEPTGNLDPGTSAEIMNLLISISKINKCTILMATHDYTIIKSFPSKILKCENGKIHKGESIDLFV